MIQLRTKCRPSSLHRAQQPWSKVTKFLHMSWADLFGFTLNSFDGAEALQGKEIRHFWNSVINKEAEVHDWRLQQSGLAQCLLKNQLLVHHLVNDAGGVMFGFWRVELDLWTAWLLALSNISSADGVLFGCQQQERSFICQEGLLCRNLSTMTVSTTKTSRLAPLPWSLGQKELFCTGAQGHRILYSIRTHEKKTGHEVKNEGSHYLSKPSVHWPWLYKAC